MKIWESLTSTLGFLKTARSEAGCTDERTYRRLITTKSWLTPSTTKQIELVTFGGVIRRYQKRQDGDLRCNEDIGHLPANDNPIDIEYHGEFIDEVPHGYGILTIRRILTPQLAFRSGENVNYVVPILDTIRYCAYANRGVFGEGILLAAGLPPHNGLKAKLNPKYPFPILKDWSPIPEDIIIGGLTLLTPPMQR